MIVRCSVAAPPKMYGYIRNICVFEIKIVLLQML